MSRVIHYLRQERRRLGLTQDDVRALLGLASRTAVKRHEGGRNVPSIRLALSYEVIFGKPVAELFGGLFATVMESVSRRARERGVALLSLKPSPRTTRRKRSLAILTS